ncbi:hypothetical protein GCM10027570_50830 [Streptomonospora sediminis]
MADQVGAEQRNALHTGAEQVSQGGQGIRDRVQALLGDLEQDQGALQGNALKAFRDGQAELVAAMNTLTDWCSRYGVNLELGNARLDQTDVDSAQEYSEARSELSSFTLSRSPNA